VSVEAGLLEMLVRMEAGKFKVFAELKDWFEEFRLYHRKDGRVAQGTRRFNERHALRHHDVEVRRNAEQAKVEFGKHRANAGGWMI
jgi:hypothetical protein